MKKHFKKIPYKLKLLYTMWMFVFIPFLLIYVITTYITVTNSSKTLSDTTDAIKNSINTDLNNITNEIDDKFAFITTFEKIQHVLSAIEREPLSEAIETSADISSLFESIFYDYRMSEICIYTTNRNIFNMEYIKTIPEHKTADFQNLPNDGSFTYSFTENENGYFFQYLKKFSYNSIDYHILSITLPLDKIFNEIKVSDDYYCVYHSKESNTVIPLVSNTADSKKGVGIFENYINGKKQLSYKVNVIEEGYMRNSVYIFYSMNSFILKIIVTVLSFILLLAFLIFILYFIINTVVTNLTSRLSRITSDILESDSLLPDIKNNSYDDFDIIQNKLSNYAKKILENNDKILKLELELLNSKISPHFLYNNLATIKYSCDNEKIDTIVDNLVLYYRRVFHQSSAFMPVKIEIENIKTYIELLSFAYDLDFEYECSVSTEAREKNLPSNIIQPLIENAFIHGINNSEAANLFIKLSINTDNDKMIICVSNNGNPPDLERIKSILDCSGTSQSALSMIKKRLDLYFSKSSDMKYSYNDDITSVRIDLPIIY